MHQIAAHILRSYVDGVPVSEYDYKHFVSTMALLRLGIATLQHEFVDALTNLDPLTGAPNRSEMVTHLCEERELAKRNVSKCVIVMMEMDNFKNINDKYGYVVGDNALIDDARYLMEHLGPYDRVFRYGVEEFLICLSGADLESSHDLIDRLREELGSLPHDANGQGKFQTTVSFGRTLLDPDLPVEESIERANKALYVAKKAGRNRCIDWDASMISMRIEPEGSA
jgi:diguanylate cyclase